MDQHSEQMRPLSATIQAVADLLGGDSVLPGPFFSGLDAHDTLMRGLPGEALTHLIDNCVVLHKAASLEKAVGISRRTFQRRKDKPEQRLSQEQSGRAWKFAEILARATAAFGSRAEAEHWLERPAIGLNQIPPLDLLATPAGVQLVEQYLLRIEYGVYA